MILSNVNIILKYIRKYSSKHKNIDPKIQGHISLLKVSPTFNNKSRTTKAGTLL